VIGIPCGDDALRAAGRFSIELHVLGHVGAALAVAVNVFPCGAVVEGEPVGARANDGAVLIVESLDGGVEAAGEELADVGDVCCGEGLWAGEVAERVEVDVVDCEGDEVSDQNLEW
jgi:hypothetical protein